MIPMSINFRRKGDGPLWPDLTPDKLVHLKGEPVRLGVLEGGMQSGAPSMAIRVDLDTGASVVVETSAKLFVTMARAIEARYPNLLD